MSYVTDKNHTDYLVDAKLHKEREIIDFLEQKGVVLHYLPADFRFYEGIKGHPDIVGCPLFCKTIIEPSCYEKNETLFKSFQIEMGQEYLFGSYPRDILYNVAVFGRFAIHGKRIDCVLQKELRKANIESIVVKQGYSKCSVVVVDAHSIITSDVGIWRSCKDKLDVLLISVWEDIVLANLPYGFLGGCSLNRGNKIYFTGEIERHPDYEKMEHFAKERGVSLVSMRKGSLMDVGSFVPLYRK